MFRSNSRPGEFAVLTNFGSWELIVILLITWLGYRVYKLRHHQPGERGLSMTALLIPGLPALVALCAIMFSFSSPTSNLPSPPPPIGQGVIAPTSLGILIAAAIIGGLFLNRESIRRYFERPFRLFVVGSIIAVGLVFLFKVRQSGTDPTRSTQVAIRSQENDHEAPSGIPPLGGEPTAQEFTEYVGIFDGGRGISKPPSWIKSPPLGTTVLSSTQFVTVEEAQFELEPMLVQKAAILLRRDTPTVGNWTPPLHDVVAAGLFKKRCVERTKLIVGDMEQPMLRVHMLVEWNPEVREHLYSTWRPIAAEQRLFAVIALFAGLTLTFSLLARRPSAPLIRLSPDELGM